MTAPFLTLLAVALLGVFVTRSDADAGAGEGRARDVRPRLAVPACAVALVLSFAVEAWILVRAGHPLGTGSASPATLPIGLLDDRQFVIGRVTAGAALSLTAVVQSVVLAVLAVRARYVTNRFATGVVIAVATAIMLAIALATPMATGSDLYAYVGSAHVPNAYAPPTIPFAGELGSINAIFGTPIFPSPYGPVWLALARMTVSHESTLAGQLFALRVLGAIAFIACITATVRLRLGLAATALVALNPALIGAFVLDGHNDVMPLAFVLWALALRDRAFFASIVLAVLAAGVKAPFAVIAMLAVAGTTGRRRLAGIASIATMTVGMYALFAGTAFLGAARTTVLLYQPFADRDATLAHAAVAACAIVAVLIALARNRYVPTAAWSFSALGTTIFGWYAAWGLPYAMLERRWLLAYLASCPIVMYVLSTMYSPDRSVAVLRAVVEIAAPAIVYARVRQERSAPVQTGPRWA